MSLLNPELEKPEKPPNSKINAVATVASAFILTYLTAVFIAPQKEIVGKLIYAVGASIINFGVLGLLLILAKLITRKTGNWYGLFLILTIAFLAFMYGQDFRKIIFG